MLKKTVVVAIAALLQVQQVQAMPRIPVEQAEDMRFYQRYNWDTKVERKALYDAQLNGQFHMLNKMLTCQTETQRFLLGWLQAFKRGGDEVRHEEIARNLRDGFDEHILIIDPNDGRQVSKWLVRDFAEAHYAFFTGPADGKYDGPDLRKLRDQFWVHCLAELPVKLFTQEAKQRLDAEARKEIEAKHR